MDRAAIAIYNPQDVWEREVQDAYHQFTGEWMPSFACQLASRAILKLKTVDWVEDPFLRPIRASYFFAPHMCSHKEEMVLVTHPLFLRDILENQCVNACLHDPIVFVAPPIAFYLLRDYPVHIRVRWQDVVADNHGVDFIDVGGLYISYGKNLKLTRKCIVEVGQVTSDLRKAAATEIRPDVFEIGQHHRKLQPETDVYDKQVRVNGTIEEVGIGEEGVIKVVYPNGESIVLPQDEFDMRFIIHTAQQIPMSTFPLKIKDQLYHLNQEQIGQIIKRKLLQSHTIRKMFDDFEVSPERLQDLQIIITKLDHKYAETDLEKMALDISLFEQGDFFQYSFFVVAHEIVHWLSRVKEQDSYFNDPEEVLGFVSSIAVEMESGEPLPAIWEKIYPKISWHFNDERDAKLFFQRMLEKAHKLNSV
jgi:hypothetical protein